jgi:hypothetical protein
MPSCFALIDKSTGKRAILQDVDKELCEYLGVEVSETKWVGDWYNCIGLGLAIGHDWDKLRGFFPEHGPIIDYLESRFESDNWKEWR